MSSDIIILVLCVCDVRDSEVGDPGLGECASTGACSSIDWSGHIRRSLCRRSSFLPVHLSSHMPFSQYSDLCIVDPDTFYRWDDSE